MQSHYNKTKLKRKIAKALQVLLEKDRELLAIGVNERSVSQKLATYLEREFPEWTVDSEYNRKGTLVKRLPGLGSKTNIVVPDILIHERQEDKNLLVIEIKTNKKGLASDIKKLKLFTSPEGDYNYKLGLSILFDKLNPPLLKWFVNGLED